jgi:hypothetical protein
MVGMAAQLSPRPRFQFRLRTLLLIVLIATVECAVCLPMLKEWQWRRDQAESAENIRAILDAWVLRSGGISEGEWRD